MRILSKAEEAFKRWDTKSVFAHCREIGTILDDEVKISCGSTGSTYKEKWGRFYANFNHWASLDLHVEQIKKKYENENLIVEEIDTESLLIQTKNMIRYAQELIRTCAKRLEDVS
jgi:hypothetical protein